MSELPATRYGDNLATGACIISLWMYSDLPGWWLAACWFGGFLVNLWQVRRIQRREELSRG